jgi:putative transposase
MRGMIFFYYSMKKIPIKLKPKEKDFLHEKKKIKLSKRVRTRIEILLLCDKGKKETDIADFLDVTIDTIWRTKKKYHALGVEGALGEKKRSGQPKKYGMTVETELTAIACTDPPKGSARWTLSLLVEKMRADVKGCGGITKQSIRVLLKKTQQNRG